jgi:hypothetical protein
MVSRACRADKLDSGSWAGEACIHSRCIEQPVFGMPRPRYGDFASQLVSNAHLPEMSKELHMGLLIVSLYLVSALAGAAGIGQLELRR